MCKIAKANAREILERARIGYEKYEKTLIGNKLSRLEWIQHTKEEALDIANYLRRLSEPILSIDGVCGNCAYDNIKKKFIYCPKCGAVLKF